MSDNKEKFMKVYDQPNVEICEEILKLLKAGPVNNSLIFMKIKSLKIDDLLEFYSDEGRNLLHYAVIFNNLAVTEEFYSKSNECNLNLLDIYNKTPFNYACEKNFQDIINIFYNTPNFYGLIFNDPNNVSGEICSAGKIDEND